MSKSHFWRWILDGKIASIKLGASRRTSIEAVARAIESGALNGPGRKPPKTTNGGRPRKSKPAEAAK
jgi:hypothetical protein